MLSFDESLKQKDRLRRGYRSYKTYRKVKLNFFLPLPQNHKGFNYFITLVLNSINTLA